MRQARILPPKSAERVTRGSCRLHRSRATGAPPLVAAQAGQKKVPLRTWCAHDEAHARTGTVPKESNARRTNRPKRIAARGAAGRVANEPAAAEPELEAAVSDRDQVRRRVESHRSRRREGRVIVGRAAALRSVARAGRGIRHSVRLGGNLFRGCLSWHESRTQSLHVVAARIRRRSACERHGQADREHSRPTQSARRNVGRGKETGGEHRVSCKLNQQLPSVKEISQFVQSDRFLVLGHADLATSSLRMRPTKSRCFRGTLPVAIHIQLGTPLAYRS